MGSEMCIRDRAISAQYTFDQPDLPLRFDTAALLAMRLLAVLPDSGHAVLNLNVPQLDMDDLLGVRAAPISTVTNFYSQVEDRTDTVLKIGYQISDNPLAPESDSALVRAGYAAVSSLAGISSIDCADVVARLDEAAT